MSADSMPIGGGADEDVVRATANEDLGSVPVASQSDPVAFAEAVLTYCRKWLSRAGKQEGCVAAFVNDTRTRLPGEERVYSFRRSYGDAIAGCLHRSDPALSSVRRTANDGNTVSELAKTIIDHGLGEAPAVLVDLEEGEASFFPAGVLAEERAQQFVMEDSEPVVDSATVRRFLDRFHHVCTRTSTPGVQLWFGDPRYGVPVRRVEAVLSDYMVLCARMKFEDVYVHPEVTTEEGRADVLIAPAKTAKGEPCVVELKVLRTRSYTSDPKKARKWSQRKNEKWIADGVDQASSYRGSMNADVAFLCCYDLRDADDRDAILQCVEEAAQRLDVIVLRYYVSRSHKDMRRSRPGSAYGDLDDLRRN